MHIPDKHISDQITAIVDAASRLFMAAKTPDDVITELYSRQGQITALKNLLGDRPRWNRELSLAFDEIEALHNLALCRITQDIATRVEVEYITDADYGVSRYSSLNQDICGRCGTEMYGFLCECRTIDGVLQPLPNTGNLAPRLAYPLPVARGQGAPTSTAIVV